MTYPGPVDDLVSHSVRDPGSVADSLRDSVTDSLALSLINLRFDESEFNIVTPGRREGRQFSFFTEPEVSRSMKQCNSRLKNILLCQNN